MAHRKRHIALKALELLQNIQENNADAESDAESDTSVYHLHEDNRDDSESESLSGESLVSESSNSEISNFEDTETISETDEDHVQQNNATSFKTSAETTWDFLDPNKSNYGRRSCHNVIREAPGPSTQAHRSTVIPRYIALHLSRLRGIFYSAFFTVNPDLQPVLQHRSLNYYSYL